MQERGFQKVKDRTEIIRVFMTYISFITKSKVRELNATTKMQKNFVLMELQLNNNLNERKIEVRVTEKQAEYMNIEIACMPGEIIMIIRRGYFIS